MEGALVTAARPIVDCLIKRGRSFVFSTSPSPLMAVAVSAALERCWMQDRERARLAELIDHAAQQLCAPLGIAAPKSSILPVLIGEDARTMRVAAMLQNAGFDVRGIRPPTVPRGTARLRISLTLNIDETIIAALGQAFSRPWPRSRHERRPHHFRGPTRASARPSLRPELLQRWALTTGSRFRPAWRMARQRHGRSTGRPGHAHTAGSLSARHTRLAPSCCAA